MGVIGLGTDIVRIDRIAGLMESHGRRFLDRVYRPGELAVLTRVAPAAAAARSARVVAGPSTSRSRVARTLRTSSGAAPRASRRFFTERVGPSV